MTRASVLALAGALLILVAAAFGWGSEPVTRSPAAGHRAVQNGALLFRAKGCSACHDGPDTAAAFHGPPALTDARAWAGTRRPGLSAAEYLRQSIEDPGAFFSPDFHPDGGPLVGMPTLEVSRAEVDALVAYLLAS